MDVTMEKFFGSGQWIVTTSDFRLWVWRDVSPGLVVFSSKEIATAHLKLAPPDMYPVFLSAEIIGEAVKEMAERDGYKGFYWVTDTVKTNELSLLWCLCDPTPAHDGQHKHGGSRVK